MNSSSIILKKQFGLKNRGILMIAMEIFVVEIYVGMVEHV